MTYTVLVYVFERIFDDLQSVFKNSEILFSFNRSRGEGAQHRSSVTPLTVVEPEEGHQLPLLPVSFLMTGLLMTGLLMTRLLMTRLLMTRLLMTRLLMTGLLMRQSKVNSDPDLTLIQIRI